MQAASRQVLPLKSASATVEPLPVCKPPPYPRLVLLMKLVPVRLALPLANMPPPVQPGCVQLLRSNRPPETLAVPATNAPPPADHAVLLTNTVSVSTAPFANS